MKSLKSEKDRDTIVLSELVIENFDRFMNSPMVYRELISMKCTQYSVVDVIREVWNKAKKGDFDDISIR